MHIPLDRQQDIPLYLQIEEALRRAILSGVFADGDKLPSTRTLAAELSISRLTVDNAYAELAAKGFLQQRRGSGAYVRHLPPPPSQPQPLLPGEFPLDRFTTVTSRLDGYADIPLPQTPSISPRALAAQRFFHWMNSARFCNRYCDVMLRRHSVTAITAVITRCAIP